jgi:hypothetical protein
MLKDQAKQYVWSHETEMHQLRTDRSEESAAFCGADRTISLEDTLIKLMAMSIMRETKSQERV